MIIFAVQSTCVKGIIHLMIFRHNSNRTYLNIQDLPQQHCADELSLLKIPLIFSTQVWPYLTMICPKLQHQLQNHKTGRVLVIIYSDGIYIKLPLVNKRFRKVHSLHNQDSLHQLYSSDQILRY